MGFKDLRLKLKAFKLRRLVVGDGEKRKKKRESENGKRPSWLMPISHGYHVVGEGGWTEPDTADTVVVQREEIGETELWFFGIFDARIGDGVTRFVQSHLFDKKPNESQMRRKSKETIWRAYIGARTKTMRSETEKNQKQETKKTGSASAIVINGDNLVIANLGDYRAVVCRDGEAHHIGPGHRQHHGGHKRHWSRLFFPGSLRVPKVRMIACDSGNAVATRTSKSNEIAVGSERIDHPDTEFVILASSGIWEVMKHQEAVNLIRHIEDPHEAAECLAKEALTRMSKSSISCLVIRFD